MSARAAWRLETLGFSPVYRFTAGKNNWFAAGLPSEGALATQPRAGDVALRNVPTCRLTDRVADVRERVETAGEHGCVVVTEANVVLGRLRQQALTAEPQATVESVMESGPTTIRPNTSLEGITRRMHERDVHRIIVSDPDGVLIGILDRSDADRRLAAVQAASKGAAHG